MQRKVIIAVLAIVVILALVFSYKSLSVDNNVENSDNLEVSDESLLPPGPPSLDNNVPVGEKKEFNLIAKRFEFIPGVIEVNEGDEVILHITSQDVDHGFSLPSFGISKVIPAGKTIDIEFIADKKGEYSFFCNVACGSGHGSMQGKLVVN